MFDAPAYRDREHAPAFGFDPQSTGGYRHLVRSVKVVCDADFFAVFVVKGDGARVRDEVGYEFGFAAFVDVGAGEVDGEFELFGEEAEGAEGWVGFGEFGDAAGVSETGVGHEQVQKALSWDAVRRGVRRGKDGEKGRTRRQRFGRW